MLPCACVVSYRAPDGVLTAVAIRANGADESTTALEMGTPTPLFGSVMSSFQGRFTYEPTRDGQRFLLTAPLEGSRGPISIVVDWHAAIQ